jgi:hypothetical protein
MTEDDISSDDLATDIVTVTGSRYANARIETPYFVGDMYDRPPQDFGVSIHKDGTDIALGAGTLNDDDDDQLYVYSALTPAQARKLGGALLQCAERAEQQLADTQESEEEAIDDDTTSFIRGLLP